MKYVLPGDMYQAYQKCYMQILSQNTKKLIHKASFFNIVLTKNIYKK